MFKVTYVGLASETKNPRNVTDPDLEIWTWLVSNGD